ncbi:MAG: CTP-dependent riboflavin kinase [Candidatus Micrarchaeota archaeon]|nr:CTP-dependent riboflavin kinase [Candidatus Micrarchaeota archaeon]
MKTERIVTLHGKVSSGLGEGKYFMRIEEYRRQFRKKLGIDPYFGTLNIRLLGIHADKMLELKNGRSATVIKGFKSGKSTFGDVLCYRTNLMGIDCALVMPVKSKHEAVAEIISSENLRKKLGLRDGSRVRLAIRL